MPAVVALYAAQTVTAAMVLNAAAQVLLIGLPVYGHGKQIANTRAQEAHSKPNQEQANEPA